MISDHDFWGIVLCTAPLTCTESTGRSLGNFIPTEPASDPVLLRVSGSPLNAVGGAAVAVVSRSDRLWPR